MFILTCKSALIASFLFLGAGCTLTDIGGTSQIATTATLSGDVSISGPQGYCVDPANGKRGFGRSGAVLASCVRLQESDAFDPTFGHLLTASTVGAAIHDLEQIAIFVRSDAGRQALSSSNSADDVELHQVTQSSRAVYVELTDSARPSHLGRRSWRAFTNVKGRLVILGVYQGVGEPVAGSAGEDTARDFAATVLRTNQDES